MQETVSTPTLRNIWINHILSFQNHICREIENTDGLAKFIEDKWDREEGEGGGGITRVISNGKIFEKAGVNSSVVHGIVNDKMKTELQIEGHRWFAAGLSLVIHPKNPYIPTVHANWRYFELYDENNAIIDNWFGGGTDLTPYYIFEEDVIHFHNTLKSAVDKFGDDLYPRFKKWCDDYFCNKHRNNERRGVGGIFYDHLKPDHNSNEEKWFDFQKASGFAFLQAYLPIVNKRKDIAYSGRELAWQEIRRGRYVEFNLIHDRGTLFGLKTNGRTESILMSLPPRARWIYDYQPDPGSEEEKLLAICLQPQNWIQPSRNNLE